MSDRQYVARLEARKSADHSDVSNIAEALKQMGYQVESDPSNGNLEVYRA